MAKIFVLLLVIFVEIHYILANNLERCVQENPCVCKFDEYSLIINISNILTGHQPPYLIDAEGNSSFYFSGCKNATLGNNIFSLLRIDEVGNNTISTVLGSDLDIILDINIDLREHYHIIYKSSNATVRLLCDNFPIPFFKVIDASQNQFVASSPNVCIIAKQPSGLSNGSIFLLILFITALMYFLGGGLLLYFIRGARGIEVIPNIEFWMNLPGLVKDGLIFLLSGCKPSLVTTSETYDRI